MGGEAKAGGSGECGCDGRICRRMYERLTRGLKADARRLFVVLDVPLPTMNVVLGMGVQERARLKRLTGELVFCLLSTGCVVSTPMGRWVSGCSMPSLRQEYLSTIRRRTCRRCDIGICERNEGVVVVIEPEEKGAQN